MPIASWEKFGNPEQLHIILNSLYVFFSKHHIIPKCLNQEDSAELKNIVKEYLNGKIEIKGEDFKIESVN